MEENSNDTRPTIVGLDHVQITVPRDRQAEAREFYCGLLGLAEIEKPDSLKSQGGFWLAVGDRQVHVGTEDGVDRGGSKAHVAYAVRDLEAWRATLSKRGIAVKDGLPIPGFTRFEFRDPFGNRVEMIRPIT
jgi:catechol 2,3-dioxygenase-like lactoylglutathione lyase family enzyme